MARPKEFNREVVLERAMHFFWEHGYEAASMRDLLAAMQIGRQSLYDTFGGKHSLFLACLEHYYDLGMQHIVAKLRSPDGGLRAIEEYFDEMGRMLSQKPHRSCLVINSAIELAPRDREVAAIVQRYIEQLKKGFATALKVAELSGEAKVSDIDAVAWHLTNSAMGFGPLSRARIPHSALQAVSTQILATVRA